MNRVLIVGASGMIGQLVQEKCLENDEVSELFSIRRKAGEEVNGKLKEILHQDFTQLEERATSFQEVDIAFFCIGQYTGASDDEEFKKVTVDMAVEFAQQLASYSPRAKLCFLSGAGADRSEKSKMSFARYKGMAENQLLALPLESIYIFRPGYIFPVKKREEPNMGYRIMRSLFPFLKLFMPYVTSDELAEAMVSVGLNGHTVNTLENRDIRSVLNP